MTNRERLEAILSAYANGTPPQRRLYDECVHFRDLDTEDGPAHPDLAGALPDAEQHLDENSERAALRAAREAQIAAGYLRPIPAAEIASSKSLGGKRSSFRIGGVAYDYDTEWQVWLAQSAAPPVQHPHE